MRDLFTTEDARARGLTSDALRWGERTGRHRRIERGVYGEGDREPDDLDLARARVLASRGVAGGRLAAVLHELDGVALSGAPRRRRGTAPGRIVTVAGLACTDGFQTLIDLATDLSDDVWEQALESALRKRLTSISEIEKALPGLGRARTPGTARIRRVLARRPDGAPSTESLLETLFVQLARDVDGLPDPARQHQISDADGLFVARVDLAWPDLGFFVELDG